MQQCCDLLCPFAWAFILKLPDIHVLGDAGVVQMFTMVKINLVVVESSLEAPDINVRLANIKVIYVHLRVCAKQVA